MLHHTPVTRPLHRLSEATAKESHSFSLFFTHAMTARLQAGTTARGLRCAGPQGRRAGREAAARPAAGISWGSALPRFASRSSKTRVKMPKRHTATPPRDALPPGVWPPQNGSRGRSVSRVWGRGGKATGPGPARPGPPPARLRQGGRSGRWRAAPQRRVPAAAQRAPRSAPGWRREGRPAAAAAAGGVRGAGPPRPCGSGALPAEGVRRCGRRCRGGAGGWARCPAPSGEAAAAAGRPAGGSGAGERPRCGPCGEGAAAGGPPFPSVPAGPGPRPPGSWRVSGSARAAAATVARAGRPSLPPPAPTPAAGAAAGSAGGVSPPRLPRGGWARWVSRLPAARSGTRGWQGVGRPAAPPGLAAGRSGCRGRGTGRALPPAPVAMKPPAGPGPRGSFRPAVR